MKRRILRWAVVAVLWGGALLLGFLCLSFLHPLLTKLVYTLPWGWISFLRRTLPDVSVNWSGVGLVLLVSGVVVVGLHWLCGRLYTQIREERNGIGLGRGWNWRWTAVLYAAFWLLFSTVMGAAGLARHVGWLIDSKEPLYIERVNHYVELRMAAVQVETALLEGEGRLAQTQEAFFAAEGQRSTRRPTSWERHHTLFFAGRDGKLTAIVVFPRDPKAFAQAGLALIRNGDRAEFQSMTNLPALLSRLESLKKD